MRAVVIEVGGATHPVGEDEFPLSLGGTGSRLTLSGAGASMAWIGSADGELFIQASYGAASCNGTPISTSQWLRHGDVVRIGAGSLGVEIDAERVRLIVTAGDEDPTAPPQIAGDVPAPAPLAGDGVTIRPVEFRPAGVAAGSRTGRRRVRISTIAAGLAVVALAALAWLLFSVRPVDVVVQPQPDRLAFEGAWFDWIVGGRHVLRTGSYTLVAEKAGYRRLEVPVEITSAPRQSLAFDLEKLPGLLAIETGGVAGARVFVDGLPAGQTPIAPLELAPGVHDIEVRAERYEEFATRVTIEGEGRTVPLTVTLVPRWAVVAFRSSPAGATVRVDGAAVGATPLVVELLEGSHEIQWSLPGYESRRGRIEVTANEPLEVPTMTLDPADATLAVTSVPPGATVAVDGEFRGETPLDLYLEPGQEHAVTLSKPGHEPASRAVRLRSGENSSLEVELVARTGTLEIAAWPPDAELLIDGRSDGPAGNRVLQLDAVPHAIEVQKDGYEPFRTQVTPRPGLPQTLRVTLKTPAQIFEETTPRRTRTTQGQELLLIDGGRFLTGAPRREPGRRSNEVEHEVEITRPFYIASTEVSNRQFREFRREHLSGRVGDFSLEMDHHPVVRVSWADAAAYCNWLSEQEGLAPAYDQAAGGRMLTVTPPTLGYRLPTEAEWVWVARYEGSATPRKYPWGDTLPIVPASGNYADISALALLSTTIAGYSDDYPVTAPVDSFPPNSLGLFNLGGNVAEWIHDFYAINPDVEGVDRDPLGPAEGDYHVIRGSSWMAANVTELRLSYRDYGSKARTDVGFRIARPVE